MDARLRYPPGTRRADWPTTAKPCATCGELAGRGYPSCLGCAETVDHLWLVDWLDLLTAERVSAGTEGERELADRVLAEPAGTFPWTCTDWALRLLRCVECGEELGAGNPACLECAAADAARWEWDEEAGPESMSPVEHALRRAVATLRAPHWRREAVVATCRLAIPFLLAGEVLASDELRQLRTHVIAGRFTELAARQTLIELTHVPALPWRRPLTR